MAQYNSLIATLLVFSICLYPSVSAEYADCEVYGNCKPAGTIINPGANYSINVNNTEHFGGYSITGYRDWLIGQTDPSQFQFVDGIFGINLDWFRDAVIDVATIAGFIKNETDPNSLHLNQDNWFNDSNGYNYWDGNSLEFNVTKLATTYFNATSILNVTGTYVGNITYIQQYNGNSLNITEVATNPGLDFRVNFTNISDFNNIIIRYKSSSSENHQMAVQLYDYDTNSWENYGYLSSVADFDQKVLGVFDPEGHNQNGTVQLRFISSITGNPSHIHYFDWVTISKGLGVPIGQEIDPLSYHKGENIDMLGNNITNVTAIVINNVTGSCLGLEGISKNSTHYCFN